MDIKTAPKDGSQFLVTDGKVVVVAEWSQEKEDEICFWDNKDETFKGRVSKHWMP